jgi:hypothetical protein
MYTVYHIPGVKIGCSNEVENRVNDQGYSHYDVLETHTDIYLASKREQELQKEYGYKVDDIPYYVSKNNRRKWTQEDSEKGAETVKKNGWSKKLGDTYGKISGANNAKNGTGFCNFETRSKAGTIGGPIGGRITEDRIHTCDHCGKQVKGRNFYRWHGNNCKHKK